MLVDRFVLSANLFLHVSGSWSLSRCNLRSGSTNLKGSRSNSSSSWSCLDSVGAGSISLMPVAWRQETIKMLKLEVFGECISLIVLCSPNL